jgi:autotransporter family porin
MGTAPTERWLLHRDCWQGRPGRWQAIVVVALLAIALGLAPGPASAATINVACGDVPGLKAAITSASPNDTILLAAGCTYTLTAVDNNDQGFGANGLPLIQMSLNIGGNNATITRSGTTTFRFFDIAAAGSLTLDRLTLRDANVPLNGGAILIKAGGALAAFGSTFSNNNAVSGGGIFNTAGANLTVGDDTFAGNSAGNGGGIINSGTASVSRTTFVGNSANAGGAITNAAGTLTVSNSTFSGNTATSGAGAISNSATATVASGTLSGNTSSFGFGAIAPLGPTTIQNTIAANNTPQNCGPTGPLNGGPLNVSWPDPTCSGQAFDPRLGPLANNGGPTETFALLPGSPAIDAVPSVGAGCLPTDQRGIHRPQGSGCDIGAFELAVTPTPPPPPTPTPTLAPLPAPPSTGHPK